MLNIFKSMIELKAENSRLNEKNYALKRKFDSWTVITS